MTTVPTLVQPGESPAFRRLTALVELDEVAQRALRQAIGNATAVRPRGELLIEGREIPGPQLLVDGWAVRVRILPDGRRQLLSFLLPGDLIGMCAQPDPLAVSTVIAITTVKVCHPPAAAVSRRLAEAYAISQAFEEAYLLAQITRLGRLNAQERICDLFLELHERLTLCGQTRNGAFNFPLTQEMLGDALGLTPVHINRMVQAIRRAGDLEWRGKRVTIKHPETLAWKVARGPVRVQDGDAAEAPPPPLASSR